MKPRSSVAWCSGTTWLLSGAIFCWFAAGCGNDSGVAPMGDGGGIDSEIVATAGSSITMVVDRVAVDDRQVSVDFHLRDLDDRVLDHRTFTIDWTLAMLTVDAATGASGYQSLITRPAAGAFGTTEQPAAETAGTYQELDQGRARYVYAAHIPDALDLGATFRVGAWAEEIVDGGSPRVANATADFVPNGKSMPQDLDSVATAACNQCHDPLSAHGGVRREVSLCVTCHTTQLFDPDSQNPGNPGQMNPLDFQTLVHRIHEGQDLPTIAAAAQAGIVGAKFDVIGYRNSDHVYAETVANGGVDAGVDGGVLARATGVGYPRDQRDCTVCHQQAPAAAQWDTVLSRAICGSCHDATWFAATQPPALFHAHAGGPMADDTVCSTCHPSVGAEFDISVSGAHTVPEKSTQLRGLRAEIVSAAGAAGGNPVVIFQVTNGDGSPVTPLSSLDVLSATVSGPTSAYRYQNMIRQDVRAAAQPNADGTWTYQFVPRAAADPWFPAGPVIPADAQGTFAVALEGRRAVTLAANVSFEEGSNNPVAYFSVDGSALAPFSSPVDVDHCNRCHGELLAHGNLRRNPEYCVLCHTADATDWSQRPKGPDGNVDLAATVDHIEARSIHFPVLVHRIHTGENLVLTMPFVVYGFRGSVNRFGDVRFPGNLADCTACHRPDDYLIETIPPTALPTIANETATILHQGTPVQPPDVPRVPVIQSTCMACHDDSATKAHASLQTTGTGVETCMVCHGEEREASVRTVHLAN